SRRGVHFGFQVVAPGVRARAQVVAKEQMTRLPFPSGSANVDVDLAGAAPEGPEVAVVLVAASELHTERLDRGRVAHLVLEVANADLDVDHGLGRHFGPRRGSYVLD